MNIKTIILPEGAKMGDLYRLNLHLPLKEAADLITQQNRAMIERSFEHDFKPAVELDASGNSGYANLHFLAEQVVLYPEGWVPFEAAEECRESTEELLERLLAMDDAPVEELDEFRYRLRNFFDGWTKNYSKPRMEVFYYRKRIYRLLNEAQEALNRLHKAYLLQDLKRRLKRRTRPDRQWSKAQRLVFGKIDELRAQSYSIVKAIEHLRQGAYSTTMGQTSTATWKCYYHAYKRGE